MKSTFLPLLLILNYQLYSQTTIKGKISCDKSESIISANIILKDFAENTIAYTYTDESGKYEMQTEEKGKFILYVNSLGYEQKSMEITIGSENEKIVNFVLIPEFTELEEVFIEAKRPITIKKDTIVFDVQSYLQGNEQVVEDLLKKIPGVNVSSDGTIKIGNQEIEKVMIEGDDIFEKGYKILTKNMPVNPLDKIEIYQNYSNNKHLKGIENSEKVALNLTLKEDAKRIWFSNASGGYGVVSENRYEVRGNLMNFGKKDKYYFLTNLNNIGVDVIGDISHLVQPYRSDEPGSIGDNQSANTLLDLSSDLPNLKPKRINFNNAEMLSLNSIFTLTEKIKLKTLGFLSTDENDFFRNSYQSFSVGNTSFENTEDFSGKKTQIIAFGKIDLTYDISENKTLEYSGKFNKRKEKNRSNLLFNNDPLKERLTSNNQLFDQKLVFTNKFKDTKALIFSGRYINEKTPQSYSVNQFIFNDLFPENANNTAQQSQNKMQFLGFEAHLLDKKKNGSLLEIKAGNQLRIDDLTTKFNLFDGNTVVSEPANYQNNLTYTTNDLYLSAKYRFKLKKFDIEAQSDFHYLNNRIENQGKNDTESPFFIIQKIGLDWNINDLNKIKTSYSYNTTNAGVLDIYSGYVQTSFRSFSKGLEDFNQLNSSNAILNYTYGNWGDKFFANTFVLYSKSNDFYSTNSIIVQNYSQSEKIIIKDREFVTISSSLDYYFNPIRSNLKINLSGSKANFKNVVNGSDLREIKTLNAEYGFELRSGFRRIFNYHMGSKWNYNQVKTTIENSFTDNMTFLDLSFVFNDKLNFQIQTERYFFGSLESQNNKYYFMDLEARYIVKENKLTFSVSGNNLFNTETFKNYTISDISISKTEYRLQERYVLLKVEYRF